MMDKKPKNFHTPKQIKAREIIRKKVEERLSYSGKIGYYAKKKMLEKAKIEIK